MLYHRRSNKDQYTMEEHNAFSAAWGGSYTVCACKNKKRHRLNYSCLKTHLKKGEYIKCRYLWGGDAM